jgi:hypothetical protein
MIRLLGPNAGLLSNALEVGNVFPLMIDGPRLLASIPMSLQGQSRSARASARSNHVRYTPTATGSSGALE